MADRVSGAMYVFLSDCFYKRAFSAHNFYFRNIDQASTHVYSRFI